MTTNANKIHTFEERGLGIAPFHFVRFFESKYCACPGAPVQPGTSCDYCGTGIMNVFVIEDSNGKSAKVGCECIKKTGDVGLIDVVKREVARQRAQAKYAKRLVIFEVVRGLLNRSDIQEKLAAQPHPNSYYAGQGKTRLDWAEWMRVYAGDSGIALLKLELESL